MVKVDVDQLSDISEQFGIESMPTFVAYVNQSAVETMRGANKAGLEALVAKYAAK